MICTEQIQSSTRIMMKGKEGEEMGGKGREEREGGEGEFRLPITQKFAIPKEIIVIISL